MSTLARLTKLRKMSAREIRARIQQRLSVRRERKSLVSRSASSVSTHVLARIVKDWNIPQRRMPRGCGRDACEQVRKFWPEIVEQQRHQAIEHADSVLAGHCTLLGREVNIDAAMDWHVDQLTGYRWPREFYADVPIYEMPRDVDVKHVWELNRHQFFVDLARAWRLSDDERYAIRLREMWLDWIDKNPLYEGVNWTSGLEVAMRSISWVWSLAFCSDWSTWSNVDRELIVSSMIGHATYLKNHFSYYSSPYNHLIGEAVGLLLLSDVLQPHPDVTVWRAQARQTLEEHGPRQFYDDGFCVEQATGYHYFTLGFLAQAVVASRAANEPLAAVEKALPAAFRAGAAFIQPDGRWPVIGDVDSARSIPLAHDNFWDFRSLNSLGAVLFNMPGLKQQDIPGEEVLWMCGAEGLEAWERLDPQPPESAAWLHDSGYAVARSSNEPTADWLLLDAGPLGDGVFNDATPSVSHGHADALSLLVCQHGKNVLVDSGTPSYAGDRAWVDTFRSAAAHNTIVVEGLPIARQPSRLAWAHVHGKPQLDANLESHLWLARGRLRLGGTATITRCVLALPGCGIWVADCVELDRARDVRWHWQTRVEPQNSAENSTERSQAWTLDQTELCTFTDSTELVATIDTANEASPVAWISGGYGIREPGYRISLTARAVRRAFVMTFLGPRVLPFAVHTATDHLASEARANTFHDAAGAPRGEIALDIELNQRVEHFVAGLEQPNARDPWRIINGVGNWPAATTLARDFAPVSDREQHHEPARN